MEVSFIKSAFEKRHYPPPERPEIAFAGKSNVGKSSLINVLVNRNKLARTSSTPGRTQALNFFNIDKNLCFVDLPGYGFAKVSLSVKASWGSMVETYLKGRENLKAVIVIMDIRRDISVDDINLINWLIAYKRAIIPILTKVDKLNRRERESRTERLENAVADLNIDNPILFSARTREGKDVIWKRIEEALR
ncbi:MAG: YihA family ribosome biogenesis GTP-binding protein [Deltaproteobacteria bacterium]|jgi:GTP-binding protein|nr:YihA family ribosome biogenesis GTP-binding protein [Deltaproteobacteria bacterium]